MYWLEQTEADVPSADSWLSRGEAAHLATLWFSKRRKDWRLGRWTAKRAVAAYLGLSRYPLALDAIEIRPAPSGAPFVTLQRDVAPVAISLSHRSGVAACAVGPRGTVLGCDLESVEPHTSAFVSDFFTKEEQQLVAQADPADRLRLVSLIWSAKESALKAMGTGLRLDTRSVAVVPGDEPAAPDEWRTLRVTSATGHSFRGWWHNSGHLLRTFVAEGTESPWLWVACADARSANDRQPQGSFTRARCA